MNKIRCMYCGAEMQDGVADTGWHPSNYGHPQYCSLTCKVFAEGTQRTRQANANRPRVDQNVEEAS